VSEIRKQARPEHSEVRYERQPTAISPGEPKHLAPKYALPSWVSALAPQPDSRMAWATVTETGTR
jgi:hypothetical protein